jgi:hypothetical protein
VYPFNTSLSALTIVLKLPSTEIFHFLAMQGHPNTLKWLTIGLDPTNNSNGVVTVPSAVTKSLRGKMLKTLHA